MSGLRTALALVLAIAAASCTRESKPAPRVTRVFANAPVVLISIDTLRADHLPAWGYGGVATPNIDRLRNDSVLFRNAYAHCPLTLPSHVSVLTGLLPTDNGVRDNIGYRVAAQRPPALPEILRQRGYRAGAAVSSYVLRAETGLGPMFDFFDDDIEFRPGSQLGELERSGGETANVAQRWIDEQRAPFFFFLHIYEPHAPYTPPEPFRSGASSAYDGEIAYADSIAGKFLDHLRQRGIYDRAIVVLMGDHGEGLGDHGEATHGILLYREALHVPLLIKLPTGIEHGSTVESPVGLTDVMPTILSLTGTGAKVKTDGVPLLTAAADAPRSIFSESLYGSIHLGWSALRSIFGRDHHYIDAPRPELYDVAADAAEKNNIIESERRVASRLRQDLARFPARADAPSAISAEDAAKLAALGYLTSRAPKAAGTIDPKDGIASLSTLQHAVAALDNGDAETAQRELREVLETNPNFTDARLQLARAYEATRRFGDAAEAYREVIARDPSLTEQVLIGLGTCYLNLDRLADAKSHAEVARRFNRGGADLLLARIALASKDAKAAEQYARDAMEDRHYKTAGALLAAEALVEQRTPAAAAKALAMLDGLKRESAERGRDPVPSLELLRSDALLRLDRADDAIAAIRSEIAQFPQERDAYGRLAAVHLLRGDVAAANSVLDQLVRANPSPASYDLAAKTLEHFGRVPDAARFRERERTAAVR